MRTSLHSAKGCVNRAILGLVQAKRLVGFLEGSGGTMATTTVEQKALSLLAALERSGKAVSRISIEGRRIEICLTTGETPDEFDRIDMRHDKT